MWRQDWCCSTSLITDWAGRFGQWLTHLFWDESILNGQASNVRCTYRTKWPVYIVAKVMTGRKLKCISKGCQSGCIELFLTVDASCSRHPLLLSKWHSSHAPQFPQWQAKYHTPRSDLIVSAHLRLQAYPISLGHNLGLFCHDIRMLMGVCSPECPSTWRTLADDDFAPPRTYGLGNPHTRIDHDVGHEAMAQCV